MSDKFLIYGCGELAWAQRASTPFGDDWITGRLEELLPLEPGGALAVSLADELDGQMGWKPQREPPSLRLEIHHGRQATAPCLPSWEDLAAQQAARITEQFQEPGVLVTPRLWSDSPRGRAFLRAWGRQGWSWATLEEVADLKFPSAVDRIVSAGSIWLRLQEPGGSVIVANGAEAAFAVEAAPGLLANALKSVDTDLAAEWRSREGRRSGWFTQLQIVRRITEALRDGRRSLELGTPEAPLFLFSDTAARQRFSDLGSLLVTVDLPPLSAAIWWEQIAEPGFLQGAAGAGSLPAIRWEALETILLGHTKNGSPTPRELRSLHNYLRFNGRPLRLVDPATLVEAVTVAGGIERRLARWETEDREAERAKASASEKLSLPEVRQGESARSGRRAAPAQEASEPMVDLSAFEPSISIEESTTPEVYTDVEEASMGETAAVVEKMVADPLFDPRPDYFYVEEPHNPEYLKVRINDEKIAPDNLSPARLAEGKMGYRLTGVTVPRGAIVRLDYEPTAAEAAEVDPWRPQE